jgi:hypothetical protein
MNGSGGLLTEYSFGVCRDPADYQPNIHSMYAGVRRITNWIFNSWNNQIKRVKIEYSIVGMIGIHGSKYLIVGMIGLGGSEYSIVRMIGLGRSEFNI